MSDKNAAVLEYLIANSELARLLEEVTLEELLAHQTDFNRCVELLSVLPKLEKDCFKPSNCLLDHTEPYDSLIGMSNDDLVLLRELCDYFMLSGELYKKLDKVIENGHDIEKYKFMICDSETWIIIGDVRGLKWALDHGAYLEDNACEVAAYRGNLDCLQYLYKTQIVDDNFNYSYCARFAINMIKTRPECFEWLYINASEKDKRTIYKMAKENGCLEYITVTWPEN